MTFPYIRATSVPSWLVIVSSPSAACVMSYVSAAVPLMSTEYTPVPAASAVGSGADRCGPSEVIDHACLSLPELPGPPAARWRQRCAPISPTRWFARLNSNLHHQHLTLFLRVSSPLGHHCILSYQLHQGYV